MFKITKATEEEFQIIQNKTITHVNMNSCGFSEEAKGFRINRSNNYFKVLYFERYQDDIDSVHRTPLHIEFIGRFLKFKKKSYFLATVTYPLKFWTFSLAFLAFSVIPIHDFQLQSVIIWLALNLCMAFLTRKEYNQLAFLAEELLKKDEEKISFNKAKK